MGGNLTPGEVLVHVLLSQLETRRGVGPSNRAAAFRVCWCEHKARKAGEVLPGAGGMRVVPSQTSKGKGSPLALRPELGFHRRSHACPQPKTGWEGSVLPPTWPPLLGTGALPNA